MKWFLPILIPLYMFVSHYKFSFSRMRLEELIVAPILMLMIFFAVQAGIWVLNQLIAFEFRMTYNAIRPLIDEKPTGMMGRLGTHRSRDSILPGEIRRLGEFGSDRYSIHFCRDVSVRLPIRSKRKKHLVEQGQKMGTPFKFDKVSGERQLIPYFLGVYLVPIPVLLLISLAYWGDYVEARDGQQQQREALAFEELVLQRRLDGQPMTASACEAEAEKPHLCLARACVPASEGQPYGFFERVEVGQDDLFCPSVAALAENVSEVSASLQAEEHYSPPVAELVPALLAMVAAGLVSLLMMLEIVRHLLSFA